MMISRRFQLSCLALCVSCGSAVAADLDLPVAEQYPAPSPYYASLHGGITFPDDPDVDFSQGNLVVPGQANNDNGFRVGSALGYNFSEILSGEVEVSYTSSDVDSITIPAPGPGEVPTSGDGSLLTIMGNVVLGQNMGGWRPYIGAGAGAAHVNLDVSFDSGVDDSNWTWAVQGFAGVDMSLTENMSLGACYRYLHIGSTDFSDGNGLPVNLDDTGVHSVEAVLTVNFGG